MAERSPALRSAALTARRPALVSRALGAALAALVLGASGAAGEPPAPIFVVRHAEKRVPDDPDSPLSREGVARAEQLAERLRDRGIRTIFVSEKRRTRETAAPLAQQLGIAATVIDSAIHVENPRAFAASIEKHRARGGVLVVTHSNAIPRLICALAGQAVPDVGESEYDRIYTFEGGVLTLATYGAAFSGARPLRESACEAPAP